MFREALSARIDGEPEPVPSQAVDQHLAACPACRSWQERARVLRRAMTVRAAPVVPDLTETILERIPAPSGARWPVRIALIIVAIAQLTLAAGQVLGVATGMNGMAHGGLMTQHLGHESTAWNLAVGVGLFWAALRPRAASGQLPVMAGFVLMLTALSAADLATGAVTTGRLATHVFAVLGVALLFLVRRQHRDRHHPHPVTGSSDAEGSLSAAPAGGRELATGRERSRRWRRLASGRHAA